MVESNILYIFTIALFSIVLLLNRVGNREYSWRTKIGSLAWILFGIYWLASASKHYGTLGYWMPFAMVLMTGISFYFAYLYRNREDILDRLTLGFLTMSVIYLVFSISGLLKDNLTGFTASNTLKIVKMMGVEAALVSGNKIALQNQPFITEIILICTGLSAISFFVGVIAMSKASLKKKVIGSLIVSTVIYILAAFRTSIGVSSQYWRLFQWWPSGGMMDSFYFAEEIITPIYVMLLGAVVSYSLLDRYPDIEELFRELLEETSDDFSELKERIKEEI